jgi:hypothetical protein
MTKKYSNDRENNNSGQTGGLFGMPVMFGAPTSPMMSMSPSFGPIIGPFVAPKRSKKNKSMQFNPIPAPIFNFPLPVTQESLSETSPLSIMIPKPLPEEGIRHQFNVSYAPSMMTPYGPSMTSPMVSLSTERTDGKKHKHHHRRNFPLMQSMPAAMVTSASMVPASSILTDDDLFKRVVELLEITEVDEVSALMEVIKGFITETNSYKKYERKQGFVNGINSKILSSSTVGANLKELGRLLKEMMGRANADALYSKLVMTKIDAKPVPPAPPAVKDSLFGPSVPAVPEASDLVSVVTSRLVPSAGLTGMLPVRSLLGPRLMPGMPGMVPSMGMGLSIPVLPAVRSAFPMGMPGVGMPGMGMPGMGPSVGMRPMAPLGLADPRYEGAYMVGSKPINMSFNEEAYKVASPLPPALMGASIPGAGFPVVSVRKTDKPLSLAPTTTAIFPSGMIFGRK